MNNAAFAASVNACDPAQIPVAIGAHLFQSPTHSYVLAADGFVTPLIHKTQPPQFLFPKLATKSWRDAPTAPLVRGDMDLDQQAQELATQATPVHTQLIATLRAHGLPVHLHLYPWVDFTQISEMRVQFSPTTLKRSSAAFRGASANVARRAIPHVLELAQIIAALIPLKRGSLDFTIQPSGQINLLEINPRGLAADGL